MDKYERFCTDMYQRFQKTLELDGTYYLIVSGPQFYPDPKGKMSEELYDYWKDQNVAEDHYEVTLVRPGSLFHDYEYVNNGGGYSVVVHATRFLLKLRENENKDFFDFSEEHQILDSYDLSEGIDRFRYDYMRTVEEKEMTIQEWLDTNPRNIQGPYIFCDRIGTEIQLSQDDLKERFVDGFFKDYRYEQNIIYIKDEEDD